MYNIVLDVLSFAVKLHLNVAPARGYGFSHGQIKYYLSAG